MVVSASIILTLGVLHLVYTFWGPKLKPRDPALQVSMSQVSPVITKETTMWRAWVGVNAQSQHGRNSLRLDLLLSGNSPWPVTVRVDRSYSWSGWQCLAAFLRSARCTGSAARSLASVFHSSAMSRA